MKLNKTIHKLKSVSKTIHETWKYGGIKNIKISYLQPSQQLRDKDILITGGGGIGKSIAKACLEQGARVIIIGRNK